MPSPVPRAARGMTTIDTPLTIRRDRGAVAEPLRLRIRARLGRQLGKFARHIERMRVRFEDINGPRGGVDKACSIQVSLSHLPPVVVEERAHTDASAFERCAVRCERAVRRALGQKQGALPRRRPARGTSALSAPKSPRKPRGPANGSLIGRRVGRATANLEAALERPEKKRRDALVDTALPGTSVTDRKAGGASTARRNSTRRTSGMTATLEDSATGDPSRKSTRRSANRTKQGTAFERRELAKTTSPKARARRGKQRGTRGARVPRSG